MGHKIADAYIKIRSDKLKLASNIYYLYIICIITYYAFRITTLNQHISLFLYLAVPLFLIKVLLTRYTKEEWIFGICIGILVAFVTYIVKETSMLIVFCSIFAFKGADLNKSLKIQFFIRFGSMVLVVLLAALNLTSNVITFRNDLNNMVSRYSFGYAHPNFLGSAVCVLISLYLFLFLKQKRYILKLIGCLAADVLLYYVTASRTNFLIILLTLIAFYLYRRFHIEKVIGALAYFTFPALLVASYILPQLLKYRWVHKLDALMQYRISLSEGYRVKYPISFWGHNIISFHNGILDSGYLQILLKYGIIITLILVVFYFITVKKLIQKGRYSELILMVSVAIHGFTGNVLNSVMFNFTFFFMANEIFDRAPLPVAGHPSERYHISIMGMLIS